MHMPALTRNATLVVIEFSAAWPRWLKPAGNADMAVVAQHYEGHPSSLVTQVATRTTRLEAVGWNLDRIVLVANGRVDADAIAARSILARGLLSRLRLLGHGELILTVDERLGRRAAADVRALSASLERSLRGAPVMLTARIGERSWHGHEQLADSVVDRRVPPERRAAG
jgi:hypothetical protein